MGQLRYGDANQPIDVDDRLLQYIQIIAATKLRRHESFTLTWVRSDGGGRETLWMQPSIPLHFVFDHIEVPRTEMAYLRQLLESANSATGLTIDPLTWEAQESAHRPALVPAA
ncbi:DUF7882 family protein [Microbacterium sp. H83]|uniref:DUF7882 family protein n=1 Tax=Microbacterium sp. H83 TaxID=1827324 RepID=UPI0007F53774|nr:hypothetical protein [Microbacterium sp. H83]OAN41390.1 hypothetical protein A4X16_11125 [Microbacterium sp. H83]